MTEDIEGKAMETTHLLETGGFKLKRHVKIRLYRRRWWVAFIMISAAVLSSMMWNTLGIIADSCKHMFGWSNGDIGMASNITNISFIVAVVPLCMLLETKGLKKCTIGCMCLIFIGCLIRCFTLDPGWFFAISCMTSALAGMGSTVCYVTPALLASMWFPPNQRSMVTGVIAFCNYLGGSLSFVLGPQLVPAPRFRKVNTDVFYTTNYTAENASSNTLELSILNITKTSNTHDLEIDNMEEMKTGMINLMYLYAAISAVLLLCTLMYFPEKPPTPPSYSASVPRTDYRQAIQDILKNKDHWLVVAAGSLPRGIMTSWFSVFDIPAAYVGISQVDAGMIAFCSTMIGACSGLLFSKLSQCFGGRSKRLAICISVTGAISSVWAGLLFTKIIDTNLPSLYTSSIVIGLLTYGTVPLFFEMSAEAAFPVSEGVAGGLYTLVLHVVSVVYFFAMYIPNIGVVWMTWAVVCASVMILPCLVLFQEKNARSALDKAVVIDT